MTDKEISEKLQSIAKEITERLPEGMGFALLAYEFENSDTMLYVSNSNREDVLTAMTEFLQKNMKDPDVFGKDV